MELCGIVLHHLGADDFQWLGALCAVTPVVGCYRILSLVTEKKIMFVTDFQILK